MIVHMRMNVSWVKDMHRHFKGLWLNPKARTHTVPLASPDIHVHTQTQGCKDAHMLLFKRSSFIKPSIDENMLTTVLNNRCKDKIQDFVIQELLITSKPGKNVPFFAASHYKHCESPTRRFIIKLQHLTWAEHN